MINKNLVAILCTALCMFPVPAQAQNYSKNQIRSQLQQSSRITVPFKSFQKRYETKDDMFQAALIERDEKNIELSDDVLLEVLDLYLEMQNTLENFDENSLTPDKSIKRLGDIDKELKRLLLPLRIKQELTAMEGQRLRFRQQRDAAGIGMSDETIDEALAIIRLSMEAEWEAIRQGDTSKEAEDRQMELMMKADQILAPLAILRGNKKNMRAPIMKQEKGETFKAQLNSLSKFIERDLTKSEIDELTHLHLEARDIIERSKPMHGETRLLRKYGCAAASEMSSKDHRRLKKIGAKNEDLLLGLISHLKFADDSAVSRVPYKRPQSRYEAALSMINRLNTAKTFTTSKTIKTKLYEKLTSRKDRRNGSGTKYWQGIKESYAQDGVNITKAELAELKEIKCGEIRLKSDYAQAIQKDKQLYEFGVPGLTLPSDYKKKSENFIRRKLTGTKFADNYNQSFFGSEMFRQGFLDYEVTELCTFKFVYKESRAVAGFKYRNFNWDGDNDIIFKGLHANLSNVSSQDDDILSGSSRSDNIFGDIGHDFIYGNLGKDILSGGDGNDRIWGGDHGDILKGNADNDMLSGCEGSDELFGGPGADRLIGGRGDDRLEGGGGADVFIFRAGYGDDVITDFNPHEDKLEFGILQVYDKQKILDLARQSGSDIVFDLTKLPPWNGVDWALAGTLTLKNTQVENLSEDNVLIMDVPPRYSRPHGFSDFE